jgi:hypothetical protein
MSNDKIKRFPYSTERARRLNSRKRIIPCQISSRWLKFPEKMHVYSEESYLSIDVMTTIKNENNETKDKKLCEIVLLKEDLIKLLEEYENPENQI